ESRQTSPRRRLRGFKRIRHCAKHRRQSGSPCHLRERRCTCPSTCQQLQRVSPVETLRSIHGESSWLSCLTLASEAIREVEIQNPGSLNHCRPQVIGTRLNSSCGHRIVIEHVEDIHLNLNFLSRPEVPALREPQVHRGLVRK